MKGCRKLARRHVVQKDFSIVAADGHQAFIG